MADKPAKPTQVEREVTINGKFLRERAREALHQFFRPLTAPFEKPAKAAAEKRRA